MKDQHIVIIDASTGKVHILPWDSTKEWEDEDFQESLEQEGIDASSSDYMVVNGNDFLKFGWSE